MIFTATLPAQDAGGADVVALAGVYASAFYSGDTVTDVELVAPPGFSVVTGDPNDNITINVRQLRNGVPIQSFASLTVGEGTVLAPETPVSLPITAQPILRAGDVIDVQMQQNGQGKAVGMGLNVSVFVS
ncbi:hypothetical protein [Nocardia sp. CC227C]|uniref:hypothetical protein n=1 Tax=Nocardia sp. CC227C TaxID=3044562 RepID=UPI00278BBD71|nr:hypothetical protein [Nocardia sp. CC227C]